MVIQGHGCKYTMMTFIYVYTTAALDKRTQHENDMARDEHGKANIMRHKIRALLDDY
jgi:uncharacterized membrane protein